MKILAFTDLHGNLENLWKIKNKAKKADIIICAGDFTVFEKDIRKVLKEINNLGKKVLLINGNHENEERVENECKKLANIEFIHKKRHSIEKYTIIGYGGMGFSLRDRDFERFTNKFLKKKYLILVTHAPPYGTKIDLLWEHRGSKSITDFIKKASPLLAISGHFHEHFGHNDAIRKTIILNPGPKGTLIEIE